MELCSWILFEMQNDDEIDKVAAARRIAAGAAEYDGIVVGSRGQDVNGTDSCYGTSKQRIVA